MKPVTLKINFSKNTLIHVLLIILLGLIAYSNTCNVPFQWDEGEMIIENPVVRDFGYFLEPARAKGLLQYDSFINRYACYLTFWANYAIGGYNPAGYHAVNTAVHLANALLIYLLVVLTFKTPFLIESKLKEHSKLMALFVSALFVSHPLQTEAVTYILQRFASLAALMCLLSITAYAASRLSTRTARKYALYAMSLVAAAVAMKTKENAFTLPVMITLYELFFFSGPLKGRLIRLAPILMTMLIIPITMTGLDRPVGEIIGGAVSVPRGYAGISRADYLMTEFRVVVQYMRLLIFPTGQSLVHAQPVLTSITKPPVFLSLTLIISMLSLSGYLAYRSRRYAALRLISFGLLWFFITLSVESSVIPLNMPMNEYRAYLPSAGFFMALSAGAAILLMNTKMPAIRTALAAIFIMIPLALTGATYARNRVWQTEISLWLDVVNKSPRLAYARYNLGVRYLENGQTKNAIDEFQHAVALRPDHVESYVNLGLALWREGKQEDAEHRFKLALAINPNSPKAHYNLGLIYMERGELKKAKRHFAITLRLNPAHHTARGFIAHIEKSTAE